MTLDPARQDPRTLPLTPPDQPGVADTYETAYAEARARQRLPFAFALYAGLTLAVIVAGLVVPAGDDASLVSLGQTQERPGTRTYAALVKQCSGETMWVPQRQAEPAGGPWDTITRMHTSRMELRYCEQLLGGELLARLLGIAPAGRE